MPRLPPRPSRPVPAQPRPAETTACARARARARSAGPILLPSVRAPHAQSAPAVSVCLNRKADILVPLGPYRPTPPGFRRRDSPSPGQGTQPFPEAPRSAAAGTRLSSSSPPALQSLLSFHRAPTSPCPAEQRGSSPSSDGTKWESEPIPREPALGRVGLVRRVAPRKAGDAGLDRLESL